KHIVCFVGILAIRAQMIMFHNSLFYMNLIQIKSFDIIYFVCKTTEGILFTYTNSFDEVFQIGLVILMPKRPWTSFLSIRQKFMYWIIDVARNYYLLSQADSVLFGNAGALTPYFTSHNLTEILVRVHSEISNCLLFTLGLQLS
ncbi:hypothetical protein ACJX0J_033674, partial [Zea mays]